MNLNILTSDFRIPIQNPNSGTLVLSHCPKPSLLLQSRHSSSIRFSLRKNGNRLKRFCLSPSREILQEETHEPESISPVNENGSAVSVSLPSSEEKIVEEERVEFNANDSIWGQMKEIMMFSGPATGLWICGPLMSLIDTAVIGQGSSIELAALGPGTVICDYVGYVFMFLSIATTNMVAAGLAGKDRNEVQHQISILLFVGLTCGIVMLVLTKFLGSWALTAFIGSKNLHLVPAANTYVQIRGLAWPAVLIGCVAQSASLGMKDSWGPLKALAVASVVNAVGDIVLCSFMGYGIAGAAWATMVSQIIAGYMMIETLNKKGYNGYSISIPMPDELLQIFEVAAPVFVTMVSKVAFYSLIIYFATSMGTNSVAAHQVMIQIFGMCVVWGEPLSQTAQSFMPELIYGVNRSLEKARSLLKSLLIIGVLSGLILGSVGVTIPLLFPYVFTRDPAVISEMHKVLIPYLLALLATPPMHSLEGTLLAGRDLNFISISMSGCFCFASLLLVLMSSRGVGLPGCWFALVAFQWTRLSIAFRRLTSPSGILHADDLKHPRMEKPKAA
ncbi:Multi antimicrobial extrusion protein [Dillenia turbinata]|uniref:Protein DETOXIFICATION n=1 Tax=Dillenia turbinata TaxID=194707 RepID=A0AAN8Z0U4_9MAGN